MWGPPAKCRARDPGSRTESRHGLEQAVGQNEHRHDGVLGDSRLMAEHVAKSSRLSGPPRSRGGRARPPPIAAGEGAARAGTNVARVCPTMISASASNGARCSRITLVIEDRCFPRGLHLGENARRDGGSKV